MQCGTSWEVFVEGSYFPIPEHCGTVGPYPPDYFPISELGSWGGPTRNFLFSDSRTLRDRFFLRDDSSQIDTITQNRDVFKECNAKPAVNFLWGVPVGTCFAGLLSSNYLPIFRLPSWGKAPWNCAYLPIRDIVGLLSSDYGFSVWCHKGSLLKLIFRFRDPAAPSSSTGPEFTNR